MQGYLWRYGVPGEALFHELTSRHNQAQPSKLNCGGNGRHICSASALGLQVPRADDYVPSHVMRSICEHAGYVGDTISWTVNAVSLPGLATLDQVRRAFVRRPVVSPCVRTMHSSQHHLVPSALGIWHA